MPLTLEWGFLHGFPIKDASVDLGGTMARKFFNVFLEDFSTTEPLIFTVRVLQSCAPLNLQ